MIIFAMNIIFCILFMVSLIPAGMRYQANTGPANPTELAVYPDLDRSLRLQDLTKVQWQSASEPVRLAHQNGTWWIRLRRQAVAGQPLYLYVQHPEVHWISVYTPETRLSAATAETDINWTVQTLLGHELQSGLRLTESKQSGPQSFYVKTRVNWPRLPEVGLWTEEELSEKLQKDREILKAELMFAVLASIAALYAFAVSRRKVYLGLMGVNALFVALGINNAGLLIDWMQLDAAEFVKVSALLVVASCFALTWTWARFQSAKWSKTPRPLDTLKEIMTLVAMYALCMVAFEPNQAVSFVYQVGAWVLMVEAYLLGKSWIYPRLWPPTDEVVQPQMGLQLKDVLPFSLIFGSVSWSLGQMPLAINTNMVMMVWPVLVTLHFWRVHANNKTLQTSTASG